MKPIELEQLARLYEGRQDLLNAERFYEESLYILESSFGMGHPRTHKTKLKVAHICRQLGKEAEARLLEDQVDLACCNGAPAGGSSGFWMLLGETA
jgi:hypothetical protein